MRTITYQRTVSVASVGVLVSVLTSCAAHNLYFSHGAFHRIRPTESSTSSVTITESNVSGMDLGMGYNTSHRDSFQ